MARRKATRDTKTTPEATAAEPGTQPLSNTSPFTTPAPKPIPEITLLPSPLLPQTTTLSKTDHQTLLSKQASLKKHPILLPRDIQRNGLAPVVDATLVFAQDEAGTAVCISPEGLLLTCSHCVAETESQYDEGKVHWLLFASGQVVAARCTAWDSRRDLALLRITAAQAPALDFPHVQISETAPALNCRLVCVGHPGSEDLEASVPGVQTNYDTLVLSTGLFRGLAEGQDVHDNSEIGALMHSCWTYWGHSGAPLLVRGGGKLVGLHSSWDETSGMRRGVSWEAIRAFLDGRGCL